MGLRGRNNLTEEHFFFVTTTIINFSKVFVKDSYCDLLLKNIKHYQQRYEFEVLAYVIMPSHFHWIVAVHPARGTISEIMRDIKKYSAWDILMQLEKDASHLLKNFQNPRNKGQRRQLWMHRFDDEVIRDQKMLWTKITYIHNNPVEAGLVFRQEDYKYSSARNYISDVQSVFYVEKSWAGVDLSRSGH
ncbi:MAG: REP-associated tyrosine transposase [Melioribacteraceae bacterium]